MTIHRKAFLLTLAAAGLLLLASVMVASGKAGGLQQVLTPTIRLYLPAVLKPGTPVPTAEPTPEPGWLGYVNHFRQLAGVPTVAEDSTLDDNCFQHARYMAENNDLTHDQDPSLPWSSPAGQICAQHGNAWLGSTFPVPYWKPSDAIDGWMSSVGHRSWLLYPTTPVFGFGFYTASNNRAGAALDVLSEANFNADTGYTGWPVLYPSPKQTGVPATRYPVTLLWRYSGSVPVLNTASLKTDSGKTISITANTSLPVGHKGIQILPAENLPDDTIFTVSVTGTYNSASFSYSWKFSTGDTPVP